VYTTLSGRLPAAHELLAQSLDRKPGDIDLLFQLGRAYEQGADYEMALQLGYGKVLMMEPTDCAALAKVSRMIAQIVCINILFLSFALHVHKPMFACSRFVHFSLLK